MRTALAFSGGKDSWACLLLNKHRLHEIVVLWVNTGKNYPEVLKTIELAKTICPNFVELIVDREGQNRHCGLPSDLIPFKSTLVGQEVSGETGQKIQSFVQCCYENIALNLNLYCEKHGITELICGQKEADDLKSTSRDGAVINGVKRIMPIEDWSDERIIEFVGTHIELPSHFQFKHTSMDCYDCTAYNKETTDIKAYAKINHPILHSEYMKRRAAVDDVIAKAIKDYYVHD